MAKKVDTRQREPVLPPPSRTQPRTPSHQPNPQDNRYYIPASGGSALPISAPVEAPAVRPRVVELPQRQAVHKQPNGWFQSVLLVGVIVTLMVFVLIRELNVNVQAKDLRDVRSQIVEQEKLKLDLELQIAEAEDIRIIKQQAGAMGLEYPLPENTRYLTINPPTITESQDYEPSVSWYRTLWDRVQFWKND